MGCERGFLFILLRKGDLRFLFVQFLNDKINKMEIILKVFGGFSLNEFILYRVYVGYSVMSLS